MKQVFILRDEKIRRRAIEAIWNADDNNKVTISEEARTLDQNAAQSGIEPVYKSPQRKSA